MARVSHTCRSPTRLFAPVQCAVYGNFSDAKAQEIAVSKGKVLELLRPADGAQAGTGALQARLKPSAYPCPIEQPQRLLPLGRLPTVPLMAHARDRRWSTRSRCLGRSAP